MSTPTNDPVITALACFQCPIIIENRKFLVDLICLPLSQIDIILGMDWLSSNHILLDCSSKSLIFESRPVEPSERDFVSANQVEASLNKEVQLHMLLSSLEVDRENDLMSLPVVKEFSEVFPDNIPGLPPRREIDFSIDLVLGAAPISAAPYRMSTTELAELKKHIEELLEKKFIRPSVSPLGSTRIVSQEERWR